MASLPELWIASRGRNTFIQRGNVSGWDLRGADFSGIRLEMVNAIGANLGACRWQDFRGLDCDFTGSNFVASDLSGARFMSCSLSESDLSGCLMEGAMLGHCMLNGSTLNGAVLNHAEVGGAFFVGARLIDAELVAVKAKQAIFDEADLCNADLRRGNFELASFIGANLQGVRWDGANLEGAKFDPGTGARMLESALPEPPKLTLASYVAYECNEGARKWHTIERRDTGEAVLRVNELNVRDGQLEVVFERLDPELGMLAGYALIVFALLRDFLADQDLESDKQVTFRELASKTTFLLPK